MDIDRFIRINEPSWTELERLTARIRTRSGPRLRGEDVERVIELYQQASTHLSFARSSFGDGPVTTRLTMIVGEARAAVYGTGDRSRNVIGRFFTVDFPKAVWEGRWFIAIAVALLMVPAIYMGLWLTYSDAALEASAPDAVRAAYVEEDFEAYYSSAPAAEFSTQVLVNNIQVSFFAYALGVFATVGTAFVLVLNGIFVGEAGGLFHAAGEPGRFWGLILPHGLLELTAVCVAGGAGLQLGWSMIRPGDRSRALALAEEGRKSVPVLIGLVLVFIVAGLIEGFVTPSTLPTGTRVGIGVLAQAVFVAYIAAYGFRAGRTT